MRQVYNGGMKTNFRENISKQFVVLGISCDLASLYLEMWTNGPMSVVQLSRQFLIGRNKLYRMLNDLQELNLVNQIKKQYGSEYEALHYKNLQLLIDKKRNDFSKAQEGLKGIFKDFSYLKSANKVSSNVIHYHGLEGLKQVNWNLVNAKGMYRVYEVSRLSSYLDKEFAEKLRTEWLRRKIYTRDLTNDNKIEAHTNITEFTKKYSEYRYISPKILKIETEVYIYNDVVTVLQYDTLKYNPKSIFCVEINNTALAELQRQIYDILWEQAKPLKLINDRGKREI